MPFQPATPIVTGTMPAGRKIKARISHYWPAWGGPNCARFVGGECLSNMASGKPWKPWKDKACACPAEYPFGTRFYVLGQVWECWDRGGAIVREGNKIWLDLLSPTRRVPFGTVVDVIVVNE
jgi:hypothetical protein